MNDKSPKKVDKLYTATRLKIIQKTLEVDFKVGMEQLQKFINELMEQVKTIIDEPNDIPLGMTEDEEHEFLEKHFMSEPLLDERYIEDDSDLTPPRRKRDKNDIEKAINNAKASLEIDGFIVRKEQEQMVLDRLSGKISEEEFLKKALKLANRDENE
ncbi:hypothetical protein [Bacillus sp. ISL-46]|uniref:hypothetical protein n=1 Tax=Bacillus sp. ISL-46 TaxID=2819129 RepID=UPI001BE8CC62|nr:hypothetical protein [Bacillus sp. ISL-46]MBT2721434.1 hypothetical protein [Bacillus sp. ISL-46]